MTPRRALGLCCVQLCSHSPINYLSGYLNNTVYLVVKLKGSWHIEEGN